VRVRALRMPPCRDEDHMTKRGDGQLPLDFGTYIALHNTAGILREVSRTWTTGGRH